MNKAASDRIVVSGTGLYVPEEIITNEELVASFNQYVAHHNQHHAHPALSESSAEFILKASGIRARHVLDKKNILDIHIMKPQLDARPNDTMSLQCEHALRAAEQALKNANKNPADIDAVIVSCTNTQRAYPGIAVELQNALNITGFAFDMRVACSSATFGIQTAYNNLVANPEMRAVLLVSSELGSPQINYRDRDSHFIFGDATTAVIIEKLDCCQIKQPYEILSTKLFTQFSNNIRNNDGFMNCVEADNNNAADKLFSQQGRAVFKEVVPMVVKLLTTHLAENHLAPADFKRLWLHQANINMNKLIAEKFLGREATFQEAPIVLDRYANTGAAGSVIAFHENHDDLHAGDLGLLCSFGAGYSIGNIILKRL